MAGGADCILVPERKFNVDEVCALIKKRIDRGREFAIVVVAEGATPDETHQVISKPGHLDDFGHMGAVAGRGLTPDLFLRALECGNDLLLFSQTTPLIEQAFRAVVRAARRSSALRRRVDESIERILALKSRIEFVPLRYRVNWKARITRQVEKLRKSVTELEPRGVTV